MGDIIKAYQFNSSESGSLMKPIIYCSHTEELMSSAVSINFPLAKEFQKQSSTMMRTMRLEKNLQMVLETLDDNPVIKEFDVLFNPAYQTDVLKALINVCRKKQFSVIWPGRYADGKLYYAEEGYKDYKVYNIEDYDITVVV